MIDTNEFWRFMKGSAPSAPNPADLPEYKRRERRQNQAYMQRLGLAWLLGKVTQIDSGFSASEQLMIAARLSAVEVQTNPQRWAEMFEAMADETANTEMKAVLSLASDCCAIVKADIEADEPLTQDGAEEGVVAA